MRYRKLSPTGDYTFGNGQADFYKDQVEAVIQSVKTRLLLWLGEFFLDVEEGTPYLQGVIGKHDLLTRENVIRKRILDTEDVTGITNFTSIIDPDSRKLSISVSVSTIYGNTDLFEVTT